MTNELRIRRLTADSLERERKGDGRTVHGRAIPYNVEARIDHDFDGPRVEVHRPGTFRNSTKDPGRVKAFSLHAHLRGDAPVGVASMLDDKPDGLYAALRIAKTRAGDDALELVDAGVLDGLSVGFGDVRGGFKVTMRPDGAKHVEYTRARLGEISLVYGAAYKGADISEIRSNGLLDHELDDDELAEFTGSSATPRLDRARQILDELRVSG